MTDKPSLKPSAKPTDKKGAGRVAPEPEAKSRAAASKGDRAAQASSQEPQDSLENLAIILEPNAARFELHAIDNRILAGFLHHKFNVLVFNYLGFDTPSSMNPSLEVSSPGNQGLLRLPPQDRPGPLPGQAAGRLRKVPRRVFRR